uniref:Uncharacterized protein n=1 Tax=Arundo donax TaxID=35708 RepID=A0A0A9ED42_ARUDO
MLITPSCTTVATLPKSSPSFLKSSSPELSQTLAPHHRYHHRDGFQAITTTPSVRNHIAVVSIDEHAGNVGGTRDNGGPHHHAVRRAPLQRR